MMFAEAKVKTVSISPQKCRLVADQVRGLSVAKALDILGFSTKKAALPIKKVIMSAIANAEHNYGLDIDGLSVTSIQVNEGPVLKRISSRAKGRSTRIVKRTSHINVTVS